MADYSCTYTLTSTGGGTIVFNDGAVGGGSRDDVYWINTIRGLDGPTLRNNMKDVPFGHGGLMGRTWAGPRHPAFEGRIIVQSVIGHACQIRFTEMEEALEDALDAILAPNTGTLTWTPNGGSPHSLTVVTEVPVEFTPDDNYQTRHFDFGLFSEAADA